MRKFNSIDSKTGIFSGVGSTAVSEDMLRDIVTADRIQMRDCCITEKPGMDIFIDPVLTTSQVRSGASHLAPTQPSEEATGEGDCMPTDMPIWVINLEWDTERRAFMEHQLRELGVTYEITKAVDGATLTAEDLTAYSAARAKMHHGRDLVPGEIGCALSHIRLWERVVREAHAHVLVLEDDVVIGRMLIEVLSCAARFPTDWDFINFATLAPQVPFGEPIHDIHQAAYLRGVIGLTGAYLIRNRGAKKLLSKAFPIRVPIDRFAGGLARCGLISYGVHPKVAVQRGGPDNSRIGRRPKPFLWRKRNELERIGRLLLVLLGLRSVPKPILNPGKGVLDTGHGVQWPRPSAVKRIRDSVD